MNANDGKGKSDEIQPASVAQLRPWEKFADYALSRAEIETAQAADELAADQMDRILSAASPEELDKAMELAGLVGLRDLDDGAEIEIHSFRYSESGTELANRLGVFAIISATSLENGAELMLNTGIERIIAYLRMCEHFNRFPVRVRVAKTSTSKGEAITLLPIRKRVVKA